MEVTDIGAAHAHDGERADRLPWHRPEAEQLRAAVDGGGTAVLCQVLTGTGGVGKTQLAADHARATWESGGVDVLVWITASTRPAIVAGYAQAGTEVLGADP